MPRGLYLGNLIFFFLIFLFADRTVNIKLFLFPWASYLYSFGFGSIKSLIIIDIRIIEMSLEM